MALTEEQKRKSQEAQKKAFNAVANTPTAVKGPTRAAASGVDTSSYENAIASARRILNGGYEVNTEFITQFETDVNSFFDNGAKSIADIAYNRGRRMYDDNVTTINDIRDRSNAVLRFIDYNREAYGEEAYAANRENILNIQRDLDAYEKRYREIQNQYSAFESEDAYKTAVKQGQWVDKYQGKSAEELTSMLEDLTDEEEKEWLKSYSDSVGYQERMTFDTGAGQTAVEEMARAYADAAASQKEYENYLNNPILAMTDSAGFRKARDAVMQVRNQYGNLRRMEAALQKKREQLAAARQTQQAAVDMKQHEEYLKTVRKSGQIRPELEAARQNVEKLKPFRVAGNDALNQSLKGKLEAAEADLAKLEKEYYYSQLQEYNALKDREDFAEKSRYVPTQKGNPMVGQMLGVFNGDLDYEYVNRNRAAVEHQSKADRESGAAQWGADQSQRLQMTDEEIGIYNYLHATQGAEKAREYLDFLNSDLNRRRREQDENAFRALADSGVAGALAASALSVGLAPLKGMGYIGQGVDYLLNGKVDENAGYNKFSHASNAIRDQVAKKIEQSGQWGQVGSFAYQTAMSMADFLYSSTFAKGSQALSLAIMGSGAAADTTISAKDRGLDDRQAFTLGTIAGTAEALTEMFSLEALLNPDMLKNGIAKYVVKNVIAEGSEEMASSILNLFGDIIVTGDRSQWSQSINSYIQQGYSEGEAFGRAVADQAASLGMDFLGGAISGGILAGAYGGMTYQNQKRLGTAINNMGNLEGENLQKTLKESMGAEQGTAAREVAQQMQGKMDQGGTLSAADKGRLLQADPKNVGKAAFGEGKVRLANPMVQGIDNTSVKWQQAERLSAMTGKTVLFYNGAAVENGKFDRDSGAIYVNVNGRDPVHQVFSHELTHSMETVGAYTELADVIKQRLKAEGKDLDQMRKEIRDLYSKHGHDLKTNEQVDAEIVADYVAENLLTNEAAILEMVAAKPTLGQRILNWIDGVLAKMGNKNAAERKFLSDARAIYAKALNQSRSGENKNAPAASQSEAVQNPEKTRKQEQRDADLREGRITEEEWNEQWDADPEQDNLEGYLEENAQYSIARTKDMDWDTQINSVLQKDGRINRSDTLVCGSTPAMLQKSGIEDLPMAIPLSIISKAKSGKDISHSIKNKNLRKLSEGIKNSSAVIHNPRRNSIAFITNIEQSGAPVLIAFQKNTVFDGDMVHKATSIHLQMDVGTMLAALPEDATVYVTNENELSKWVGVTNNLRSLAANVEFTNRSIEETDPKVNNENSEETSERGIDPEKEGATYSQDGEAVAYSHGNGTAQFSLSTYEAEGRSELRRYLEKCVQNESLTEAEMQEMLDGIEEIYDTCQEFKDKYAPFGSWSDAKVVRDTHGRPVFSVVTPNGDYKMNLDFSLVCKKRRTLDAVFNEMAKRGIIDDFELGQKSVVKINEIIRREGFETACALCFVDAKRYRQAQVADSFVSLYNELVESLVPEDMRSSIGYFNFAGNGLRGDVEDGIHTWDRKDLDFSHLDYVMKQYKKGTVEYKAARYLRAHPEGRRLLQRGDFMSSGGFDAVKSQNQDILKLYNAKKGTGGPKAAFGDVQYMNEVIRKSRFWTPEKAYAVGGVRVQSFSDYVPRMVFDYVQMIYDMAAAKLPAHAYTKETLFAMQFGLTGIKINLSLIPAVDPKGIAPGLDAQGNYVWAGESFDYETAKKIQSAEGYSENCGTICVGVSKEHILKLLDDPEIRMVIPYHKSGLNPIVAHMNRIAAFTDYTGVQNTRSSEGGKVSKDFDFNKRIHELGEDADPKAVAQEYKRWCEEKGYTPKFDEFKDHPNYYKLLEDFTLYDHAGHYAPQRGVKAVFPKEGAAFGSMRQLIEQGLKEDAIIEGTRDERLGDIVDEIERTIPRREADIDEEQEVEQADHDVEAKLTGGQQFSLSKEEDYRNEQGYYVKDQIQDNARKAGYPVLKGEQVIPFRTWVRAEDRRNYGLVVGLAGPDALRVNFTNKDEGYNKTIALANRLLTPVPGVYQMTMEEYASLMHQTPEAPGSHPLTPEEQRDVDELLERAGAWMDSGRKGITEEAQAAKMNRDKLPGKAKNALQRAESKLIREIGRSLNIPWHQQWNGLKDSVMEMTGEYLETGTISDETIGRIFDAAYEGSMQRKLDYLEQHKELGAFLKKTAITVSEGVHAYDYFAKNYRNLRLAEKGGMKLDAAYAKAHEMAPDLFPEKITDPEDKLRRLNQLLWDMDVAIRDLGAHHGTNPEDFKKWARHEFETAIWDNVQDLSRAKQYAYERGRKKETRKILTVEDAEKYFEQRKQLRRDVERVSARHMLTENEEHLLGRMLRGEISREQLDPDEVNVDGIMAVYRAKVDYEALDDILREYKRSIQAKRRETADEMLKTAGRWKDKKSGFLYARETMRRNILDIVPDRAVAEQVIEYYFESIHRAEAESTKFKTEFRNKIRELKLNTKVEKGNLVSEAHAVQLLGEALDNIRVLEKSRGRMTQRDGKTHEEWVGVIQNLWKENPNLNSSKIENAVDEFRKIYDQLFLQMNKVRVANGYEPVNYRHGYFPHFQPGDGDGVMAYFGKILGIDIQVDALPTTINGLSHTFKPGIQWFGNAQERLGFNTAYDAVEGFDKYIEGVASVIFQTENIQNLRALATQVRYRTSPLGLQEQVDRVRMNDDMTEEEKDSRIKELMTDGKFGLNNFAVELDEYTNLLANKKSKYDRTMEGLIGRKAYTMMKTWENQIGANMIAGNISSALTNFIPLTQAGAQLDTGMILKGVWDTLKNIKVDDGLAGMSDFLTNRRGSDPLVKTWVQKASGVMGTPMELIDNFTSEAIVRAAYAQNLKRGMSTAEALHQADIFAASVMADRSKGSMPTLFESRNPLFKALTQFQLEVNNQVSEVFKDLPRNFRGASSGEKKKELAVLAGILLKYFLGAMLYNELYEKLVGRRPAMDPFGILVNAADTWKEEGLGAAGAQLFEETAQSVPFIGGLLGGGRLPVSGAIPDVKALWEAATTEDMAPKKRWKEIQDELNKLAYVLPPFGGAQISKIWKGTEALIKGGSYSVNNDGREILQYPVFKDDPYEALGNALRMSVLGKNSIQTAQDWAKSGYKSLNAEETAMYKDMLESGVKDRTAFDMIWKVKNTEAPAGTAQQEKTAVERKLKKDMILKSGLSKEGKAILYYGMAATDTERKWLDSLTDAGADQAAAVGFVHDLYEAGDLKGVDKKIRYAEIFDVAPLTEEEKQFAMQFVLGTKTENDNGNLTQYGKFLAAMEMGLSVNKYMEMYSNEANVDEFFEMHDAGVSLDAAADLSVKLAKLEPLDGEEKVSWYQECDVILKSKLSNADQVAALQAVSYEATGTKIRIGYENGLAPGALVYLKQVLPQFDENGNGSYTQKEVKAAIDAVCGDDNVLYALTGTTPHGFTLTNDQKAILWQLQCNGKKNPYNQAVGDRIYQQWKAASEKDEEQQEDSAQGTTTFQIRLK